MTVLVLESVSCLTPTEFETLQPATSQLGKVLNNSGLNHGKSTAFPEDFFGFFAQVPFLCDAELRSCETRSYSAGWQDHILQAVWISHRKG